LQYDRRRSRPSIDGLYGSLGGQTLELVPTLHGWKREARREGMAATQRHRFHPQSVQQGHRICGDVGRGREESRLGIR
jgi:hypothetical protein